MTKITNCLICDDVRQEVNNKVILIGVYGSDLIMGHSVVPNAFLKPSIWLEFISDVVETVGIRVVIEDNPPIVPERIAYNFSFELQLAPGVAQQASGQFPCRVDFSHALRFEYKLSDGEWQFLRRLQITQPHPLLPPPVSGDIVEQLTGLQEPQ